MDKLILLVGESGSGKTTIADELLKRGIVDNVINSYTTRPKRSEDETGHIFVEYADYMLTHNDDMIAYTYYDNNHYWATKEQYQGKGTSVYVIDPKGVKDIKRLVKDAEVIVIYLKVDESTRRMRMVYRGHWKDAYGEIQKLEQRITHDKQAFAIVQCDYCINNNTDIDITIQHIQGILEGQI